MAVYTEVSFAQAAELVSALRLGRLTALEGCSSGIENTNYFASTDQGIDWAFINAATLISSATLLVAFLLFQRHFVQSFLRAGIR